MSTRDAVSRAARIPRSCSLVLCTLLLGPLAAAAHGQVVTLDASSYTVSEGGGIVQFCLLRTGNLSGRTDGGVFTVTGTATDHPFSGGQDYIPLGGSAGLPPFTFPPGSAQICGSVIILDDNLVEGDESFEIGFEVFSGGVPGTPSLATVTILDNDSLPGAQVFFTQVGSSQRFDEPVYRVAERAVDHRATLALRCQGSLSQPAVVSFTTEEETAIEGDDFRPTAGTYTFVRGGCDDAATLQIPLIVDDIAEGSETFLVHISVSGGASLQGDSTAQVVIVDDDSPREPTVSFEVTGKRRNLHGDFVFGFHHLGHVQSEIPIRVSGRTPSSTIRIAATVDGRSSSFTIDPTQEDTHWKVSRRGRIFELELVSADNAQIGEPSRVIGVVGQDETDFVFFDDCVNCDYLYWLHDARFTNVCPDCQGTCDRPPYPGQPSVTARSLGIGADPAPSFVVLRAFRDGVMSQSATGRFYRNLYGGFSDSIFEGLLASPSLMFDALDAQDPWLDGLQALNDGQGSGVLITQKMVDDLVVILAGLKEHGSPALRRQIELEEARLDLDSLPGLDFDQFRDRIELDGGALTCQPDDQTLCLNGGRFSVQVDWTDFDGRTGFGQARPLTGDTGAFWFFDDKNIELVIKVLDGRGLNGNFWVFYGALSDVGYTITVFDTETGRVATYDNPAGTFGSRGDTDAIPTSSGTARGARGDDLAAPALLRRLATSSVQSAWQGIRRGWSRLWNGDSRGVDLLRPRALLDSEPLPTTARSCIATPTQLCLNNKRFRVEVSWRDFSGNTGVGMAAPLTDDTGTFWFFDAQNVELVIKALDGRGINGKYWVYYGALSNVEYTITVTDTATGAVKTYRNPLDEFGSVGDTDAF